MNASRATLLAGIAGILWPVLAVSRVLYSGELDQPTWDDPPSVVSGYYSTVTLDAAFVIATTSVVVAYSLLVVFMARVTHLLAASSEGVRWVATFILGLVILDVALVLGYVATLGTARQLVSSGVSTADSFVILHNFAYGFYWIDLLVHAFWLAALGGAIILTRIFPSWLGALMMATGALVFVSFFLPADAWNASGLSYLWVLILGVLMMRRPETYLGAGVTRLPETEAKT